jgi:hypothetical protein
LPVVEVGQIQAISVKLLPRAGVYDESVAYVAMPLAVPVEMALVAVPLFRAMLLPLPVRSVHTEPLTLDAS